MDLYLDIKEQSIVLALVEEILIKYMYLSEEEKALFLSETINQLDLAKKLSMECYLCYNLELAEFFARKANFFSRVLATFVIYGI